MPREIRSGNGKIYIHWSFHRDERQCAAQRRQCGAGRQCQDADKKHQQHLQPSGALGRPTWLALRYVPDWRWLWDRADSPWYPTMRLFRQTEDNNWRTVFEEMEAALEQMLAAAG